MIHYRESDEGPVILGLTPTPVCRHSIRKKSILKPIIPVETRSGQCYFIDSPMYVGMLIFYYGMLQSEVDLIRLHSLHHMISCRLSG